MRIIPSITAVRAVVSTGLVVISIVRTVVSTSLVVSTGLVLVSIVLSERVISVTGRWNEFGWTYLTGYNTIRPRDEEGNRELCNDEENERDLEALHGSIQMGRDVGLGEKTVKVRSKLLCRKGCKKPKGLILERQVLGGWTLVGSFITDIEG